MSFITIVSGLLGYVFQILMGRLMAPYEFALFTAIIAFSALISSPMGGICLAIARHIARLNARNQFDLAYAYCTTTQKKGYLAASVVLILLFLLIDHIQTYLKSPDRAPVFLLIFGLSLVIVCSINLAILQGNQRFKSLGFTNIAGVVTKIVFSTSFIYFGFGISGALLGVLAGSLVCLVLGHQLIKQNLMSSARKQHPNNDTLIESSLKTNLPMVIAGIAFIISTQLDIILVNWYFPSDLAGQYAAASVLGKAVLYLPGGLAIALLPMAAEEHTLNKSTLITKSLLITFAICFLAAAFYWVFADTLVALFYGESYQNTGAILQWFGFAILPMALIMIVENYLLAKGVALFSWLFLVLSPLQAMLTYFFHTEIWMVLCSIGASGFLILIIGLVLVLKTHQTKIIEQ